MSDEAEVVRTDIGHADKTTMDDLIRTMVAQMFENDNDTATLDVVLEGSDTDPAPTLTLEVRLTSINGVPTRSAE